MWHPTLFRRRQAWLPTIWGWLAILALAVGACLFVGRRLHAFLAPNAPVGARILVVEGWETPRELDQAAEAFRAGGYERVVTTGGPVPESTEAAASRTFADLAASYLVRHGLPREAVVAVPAPASAQDRTFLSAVMVREWARDSGIALDAIDLFSAGPHARRSWLLYETALGDGVKVGVLAARPDGYSPDAWWRTSLGSKAVLTELIEWTWVKLFFSPGPPGSHEERWGETRGDSGPSPPK